MGSVSADLAICKPAHYTTQLQPSLILLVRRNLRLSAVAGRSPRPIRTVGAVRARTKHNSHSDSRAIGFIERMQEAMPARILRMARRLLRRDGLRPGC